MNLMIQDMIQNVFDEAIQQLHTVTLTIAMSNRRHIGSDCRSMI